MLTGALNPVQLFALEVCMMLDEVDENERFLKDIKLALVANDRQNMRLFVEGYEEPEGDEITADEDLSDTEGTWKFRNDDDLEQEDVEALLAQATQGFTLTGAEMGPDDGWE